MVDIDETVGYIAEVLSYQSFEGTCAFRRLKSSGSYS